VVIEAKSVNDVPRIIAGLYNDKEALAELKRKVESIKKPDAAYNIARLALDVIK